jgi:hypothetical protein
MAIEMAGQAIRCIFFLQHKTNTKKKDAASVPIAKIVSNSSTIVHGWRPIPILPRQLQTIPHLGVVPRLRNRTTSFLLEMINFVLIFYFH